MRALVVLPTYNEAENITEVLRRLRKAAPSANILVVDDASPDGTAEIARAGAAELGGIDVLMRAGKSGLGSAYRDGFIEGLRRGYQVLVEMDSDLSHDPAALPSLLSAVDDGADLAVGSRYVPGGSIQHWSARRRALSRWGNRYARWVLALPLADATSGFRAYRADIVAKLDLASVRSDGYGFQIEMAYRVTNLGGRIVEVPIEFVDRERGTSKMSFRIIVEALLLVTWWGVTDLPGRLRETRQFVRYRATTDARPLYAIPTARNVRRIRTRGSVSIRSEAARAAKEAIMGLDPVCKMEVNPVSAEAQSEYEGLTFYFCSVECKGKFDRDPEQHLDETDRAEIRARKANRAA